MCSEANHWGIIADEIKELIRRRDIGSEQFKRLDANREHKVLQDIKRKFFTKYDAQFWWENFRYDSISRHVRNAYEIIDWLCPEGIEKVWLVVCEDELVYDARPKAIVKVLGECPAFEYAIVDKKLQWLFLDNHQDVLYAVGQAAIEKLRPMI